MDILVKTLVFGNEFMTVENPARLVLFKFEIYQSPTGFYHRMYKEVGMSGANLGQAFTVWAFEEQKAHRDPSGEITLEKYIQHCQDIYNGKVKD